jgi:hypothetical protein
MADFFINPVFLAGAAAAALPIIIHLLSRRRYKRRKWAAMEFLLRAHKKTSRRLRLENLLVLLLRIAMLVLFALALARPVLRQASVIAELGEKNRMVFLVIDNSYSMGLRRGETTPFESAKRTASEILDSLRSGADSVSVLLTSSLPRRVILEPTPDVEKAAEELTQAEPAMGVSDLRPALGEILELMKNPQIEKAPNKAIYLLTDLQRAAWVDRGDRGKGEASVDALIGDLAPKVDAIHVVDVGFELTDNYAVASFEADDKIIGQGKPASFTVTVVNHSGQTAEDLGVEFFVDDASQGSKVVTVEPGAVGSATFTTIFHEAGAHRLRAVLTADDLPVDNERHLAVNVLDQLGVLLVDGEPDEEGDRGFFQSETAYLRLALMPSETEAAGSRSSIIKPEVKKYYEITADTFFNRYHVVVLANEGRQVLRDVDLVEELENYVRSGGSLLIFLGDRIKPDDYNLRLFRNGEGLLPLRLTEILGAADDLRGLIVQSFVHPVLAGFEDRDHRTLLTQRATSFYFGTEEKAADGGEDGRPDPRVAVVARFDDAAQSAAIAEKSFGYGRVMMVTTTCDREWTKIPAHLIFLPLTHEMVYYLAREAGGRRNVRVGGLIRMILRREQYSEEVHMILPSGGRPTVEPPKKLDHGRFSVSYGPVEQAGVYTLVVEGAETLRELFSANLDTVESDLGRTTEEELRILVPPAARKKLVVTTSVEGPKKARVSGGSEFWRHLLVLVIIFLALETVLAQRFGNYAR